MITGNSIEKMRRNDASHIVLFTNARDETNLAEWVAHHLLLGFDKIVIFDHLSKTPISNQLSSHMQKNPLFKNSVSIIPVKGSGDIKSVLGNRAIRIARYMNASWMLYLDADEFLCINMLTKDKTPVTVKQLLSQWHFADAVSVNWLIFGTNGHKTQPSGLLMENFTKSEMYLDNHVKTFVRPTATKYVKDPHTYKLYNSVRYFAVDGKPKLETPFHYIKKIFTQVPAYIAHYYIQSEAEFKRRKCRAMDNGSPAFSSQIDPSFFLTGNAVVNNKLSCLYATRIKECLHL